MVILLTFMTVRWIVYDMHRLGFWTLALFVVISFYSKDGGYFEYV